MLFVNVYKREKNQKKYKELTVDKKIGNFYKLLIFIYLKTVLILKKPKKIKISEKKVSNEAKIISHNKKK